MLKIVKRMVVFCVIILVVASTSACATDTSMVEEIADIQDNNTVESTLETENEILTSEEILETENEMPTSENILEVESEVPTSDEISQTDIEEGQTKDDSNSIDLDLTDLSSTMIYSEVYNMMVSPVEYLGKTIKISGPYYANYWDETGEYYHYIIISDATACCQNGIEFIWEESSHVYPDEYPEENAEVEVVGVFSSYEELGETYYYLKTDEIAIK